jgi:uncharacterized protein YqfA (UPF0365 family)
MRMARAQAESRRAAAVAAEQKMTTRIEESRARLVEAEADVPRAMAEAFSSGTLNIIDYYRLKNVDADTQMRASIAHMGERDKPELTTA